MANFSTHVETHHILLAYCAPLALGYLLSSLYRLFRVVVALCRPVGASKHSDMTRSLSDFDIHDDTGFMPSKPLPSLPPKYHMWERALSQACDVLTLGDDESEEALARRDKGDEWRLTIRSVGRRRHLERIATDMDLR